MNERQQPARPPRDKLDRLITHYRQGRLDQAMAAAAALAVEFPDDPSLQNLLGTVNAAAGRLEQAKQHFSLAVRLNPEFAEAHYNLGKVLDSCGASREAIASYTRALKLKPDFANAYNDLGAGLHELGMREAGVASFRKAIHFKPDFAEAHNNLGATLDLLKRPDEAVESLRTALRLKPGYAEAHNNLGNALVHLGRPEQAAESYAAAVGIRPGFAEAHRNLSSLTRYASDTPHLRQMQSLIERKDLPDHDRMLLCFALGKAYDDAGQFDAAFACFADGNRLRRRELGYDGAQVRARFARIKAKFPENAPATYAQNPGENEPAPRVIFVLGMPRSGSSLVEQILASHSSVYGAGELELLEQIMNTVPWGPPAPAADMLTAIRKAYFNGIAKLGVAEPCITDKMPLNFWWIGFILTAIPDAHIVHVLRDARATCWSNFRHYFPGRGLGFTNDLTDLADYYGIYRQLMDFWKHRFPGRIFDLSYEALIANQESESRRLIASVGLDWEDRCLDFHETARPVQTASAIQVRQRLYSGSSNDWRKYADWLGPLAERLEGL